MNHFLTFGNGVFERQRQKLVRQAAATGWFDTITEETPDTIQEFYQQHKAFIDRNKRGYGYWIWKPYIILRQLEKMELGDFLFYTDSGATILPHKKDKLDQYIQLLESVDKPVLTFGVVNYPEGMFQKMKVLQSFILEGKRLYEHEDFLNSSQIESGIFICRKTDFTVQFVQRWLELLLLNNYELVTDGDNQEQLPSFVDHRHDQSILSILCKIEKTPIVIDNEAYGQGPFFSSRLTDDGPREFAPDSFRMLPEYDYRKHKTWADWNQDVYERYPNSIPVIGTAIVNGFDWMERLVASVDYPVDNFVIFDNNGKGELTRDLDALAKQHHPYIKKLTVCHMPTNIGVSGAWNLIIKSYMNAPYWIITNHDVAFVPGLLQEIAEAASDPEVGMVHPHGGDFGDGSWDLFLIKDWVVQSHGLFDENLYPAYCEDADYIMRLKLKPIKTVPQLTKVHKHGDGFADEYYVHGSQTKKATPELNSKLDEINVYNFEYLNQKWGPGWRMTNPLPTPFDLADMPITYTTYDLSYVRKKHLGF